MGKRSKVKTLSDVTDMAKNLSPTSETPSNGSDHCVPDPIILKKPSNTQVVFVRRSGRLQGILKPVKNKDAEEINLVESEKDEDDNVEQPLDEKAVEEFVHKGADDDVSRESTSVSLYKSLYTDSQKKVEALTSENRELARKLEIALGKLEVYEDIYQSAERVKILNLEKTIEALVRLTPDVGQFSSLGDGGVEAKETSSKKRRHDKKVKFVVP
ncbi:hypothetical protein CTI12_AA277990 [Artemisia annua]|uniref:Uncharacterized protein n=1 Tax=Artemisia annua TaxID=35608 RepID=A0A2U1NE98_ARTAN|nr:hypothetical protein CTI12_AA277990 [Artemisia annua]